MSEGVKRVWPVWSVALAGGVTAAVVAVVLDLAGVESLGRPTAGAVRAVAFGAALGLVVYWGRGRQHDAPSATPSSARINDSGSP